MDWMGKLSIFPLYIVFSLFFKWIISWDVAEKSKSGRQAGSGAGQRSFVDRAPGVVFLFLAALCHAGHWSGLFRPPKDLGPAAAPGHDGLCLLPARSASWLCLHVRLRLLESFSGTACCDLPSH